MVDKGVMFIWQKELFIVPIAKQISMWRVITTNLAVLSENVQAVRIRIMILQSESLH
jgi:hypothetical protein